MQTRMQDISFLEWPTRGIPNKNTSNHPIRFHRYRVRARCSHLQRNPASGEFMTFLGGTTLVRSWGIQLKVSQPGDVFPRIPIIIVIDIRLLHSKAPIKIEDATKMGTAEPLDKNRLRIFQPTLGFLSAIGGKYYERGHP